MKFILTVILPVFLFLGCGDSTRPGSTTTSQSFQISDGPASSGSAVVPIEKYIILNFTDEIDVQSVNDNTVKLLDANNNPVSKSLAVSGNIISIIPAEFFLVDHTYKIIVSTQLKSVEGSVLDSEFVYIFTTAKTPTDFTSPSFTIPQNTEYTPNSTISMIFDEMIFGDAKLVIRDSSGNIIDGTSVMLGNSIEFSPAGPLTAGETYTVTLQGTVVDAAGNPYSGPVSWTFTVSGSSTGGATLTDTDGDGIPDASDLYPTGGSALDIDGDGILNDSDPDVDGDGILNDNDPDDDNDGISDIDEQLDLLDNTNRKHPLFGQAQGPHSYNGSVIAAPIEGDKFLYQNVYTGVDAIVTIDKITAGATITELDNISSFEDNNFQPRGDYASASDYIEFSIEFVQSNTTTRIPTTQFVLTAIDNDNDEFIVFDNTPAYYLTDESTLLIYYTGSGNGIGDVFQDAYKSDGSGSAGYNAAYTVTSIYLDTNTFSIRTGAGKTGIAQHSYYFDPAVTATYTIPSQYVDVDTDGDTIIDRFDLE